MRQAKNKTMPRVSGLNMAFTLMTNSAREAEKEF